MKKKILLHLLVFLTFFFSARFLAQQQTLFHVETVNANDAITIEGGGGDRSSGSEDTSGGGNESCFPAGTKILLSDLSEKNIEDVKVGDLVLSFDGQKNISAKVLSLESPIRDHLYTLMLEDGTSLRLTREHPVYTQNGWKSLSPSETAKENPKLIVSPLQIGDKLQKSDGALVKLINITYQPGKIQTYNLKSIEKAHTFYADGYLAHNKTIDGPESGSTGEEGQSGGGGGEGIPDPVYYNRDSPMPPDTQGLYNTAVDAADSGGQMPGGGTSNWENGDLVVRDANGNVTDVFYANETGGGGSGGGGSGGEGGAGDGGSGWTPTPPPGCTPTATTCGACLSSLPSGSPVSCGGGLQHCTNNFPPSGWNQLCNTQACCTDTSPNTPTLDLPLDNAILGNKNVTVSWNDIALWGNNCSTNTNTYKVYIDTNANPTTLQCTVSAGTTGSNLMGYWTMDETTGTLASDTSGNGNDGTLSNTSSASGQHTNARQLNANTSYINVGNASTLNLTSAYTLEAWVNLTSNCNGGSGGLIVSKGQYGSYTGGYEFGCLTEGGYTNRLYLINQNSSGQDTYRTTVSMSSGGWHHVAAVFSAYQPAIYVDGNLQSGGFDSGTWMRNAGVNSNNVYIGNQNIATSLGLPGYVDDVRIYNSARSQTEIQQDMVTPISTSSSTQNCAVTLNDQTKYYWKVVASNGNSATDKTSVIRSFTIKQPQICGGTLYEDTDQNGCYETSSESPVSNNTITVSASPNGTCTTNADNTYCCTIPGTNDGSSTLVNLSASNYNPPYTGQTNCSTGTDASCSLNNCSISLNSGDVKAVHIGFAAKSWFQADSCPVYSNSDIVSLIPTTPLDFDTGNPISKYFVLNSAGPVLSGSTTALNFGTSGGLASLYQWSDINYQTASSYNFAYFEKKLGNRLTQIGSGGNITLSAGKLSDGTNNWDVTNNSVFEVNGSLTVENDTGLSGVSAVILATGDITINSNFEPTNSYLALISKTNIAVAPTVTKIHAILFADGQFSDGVSSSGLKVTGSVIALNGFNLQRSSTTGKPAEFFVCDAGMYINLSSLLGISTYRWEESAP